MRSCIEIFCEEIPARMQMNAFSQIHQFCANDQFMTFDSFDVFVSPQRLAIQFHNLTSQTKKNTIKKKGPAVSASQGAIDGFLKKNSKILEEDGYYFALSSSGEDSIEKYFPVFVENLLKTIKWPKEMRWPQSSLSWTRPIRSIYCAYNNVPLDFELFGIKTSHAISGHRFLNPDPIQVLDYEKDLLQVNVMVNHRTRKEKIKDDFKILVNAKSLNLVDDENLLHEIVGLVEYPFSALGRIDDHFMTLPKEVLTTSMKLHQKYFSIQKENGELAPYFGLVLNCPPTSQIILGYERVLRARLKDAEFFYNHDVNIPLKNNRLDNRIYHEKLGSVQDKVNRLMKLAISDEAKKAAQICKSDLSTLMVGEFPELQGVMGSIYAREQGEDGKVVDLIRDQYFGLSELSLIDKLDALVGFFGVGIEPTGSKDPYALRRAALGVLNILKTSDYYPSIRFLVERAFSAYPKNLLKTDTIERVEKFLQERLPIGVDFEKPLKKNIEEIEKINDFLKTQNGTEFLLLYKRVKGFLKNPIDTILSCATEPDDVLEKAVYRDLKKTPTPESLFVKSIDEMISRHKIIDENQETTQRRMGLLKDYCCYINEVVNLKVVDGILR